MGGRKTTRSLGLILASVITFSILYVVFFFSSSSSSSSSSYQRESSFLIHSSQSNPDYSFVPSLEKFLKANSAKSNADDTVVPAQDDRDRDRDLINKLDDSVSKIETQRLYYYQFQYNSPPPPLRVYVYEMPSKFTYDLLWLFLNTYRDTSNLTSNGSPVHRLIQQHSIDYWLWADLIAPESDRVLNNVVVRVLKQEEADLFYIPFFTTISFFLLEKQHCKALYRVKL